jgi:hypothetical protein
MAPASLALAPLTSPSRPVGSLLDIHCPPVFVFDTWVGVSWPCRALRPPTYTDGISPSSSRYRELEQLKRRQHLLVSLSVVLYVGQWLIHLFVQSPLRLRPFAKTVHSPDRSLVFVHILIVVGRVPSLFSFRSSPPICVHLTFRLCTPHHYIWDPLTPPSIG